MGSDGVNIPIRVTGADAAKTEIKGVGDAAGQASDQQRRAQEREEAVAARRLKAQQARYDRKADDLAFQEFIKGLREEEELQKRNAAARLVGAEATTKGARAFSDFNNKGEKALKEVLRLVNPELANMADLFLDVTEGASRLSVGLLALGGAGAAVGVLTLVLQQINKAVEDARKEVERLNAARGEQEKTAADVRADVAKQLVGAGVEPTPEVVQGILGRINGLGVDRTSAVNALVTEAALNARGKPVDVEQLLAGIVVTGKEVDSKDRKSLDDALRAGALPGARKILSSYRDQIGPALREKQLSYPEQEGADNIAGEIALLQKRRPDVTPEDLKLIEQLARGQDIGAPQGVPGFKPSSGSFLGFGGSKRTIEELQGLANSVRNAAEDYGVRATAVSESARRFADDPLALARDLYNRGERPIVIQITNSTGVQYNAERQFRPSQDLIELGASR